MLVIRPSPHPGTLARPFTPKVLRTKERTLVPCLFIVFTLDLQLSLSRSLGVRHMVSEYWGVPMAPKRTHKLVHETMVEDPTEDLNVPSKAIKKEEQHDFEE